VIRPESDSIPKIAPYESDDESGEVIVTEILGCVRMDIDVPYLDMKALSV
jgi:hypothetical protein